jgi:hypothetical protein
MSNARSAMAVLETSKLCHERTIFRLINNLSLTSMPLSVIGSKKGALKAVEIIFTPFCVGPGLDALMTEMMICPATDIKMILSAMKKAKLIIETLDPNDYIGKSFPLAMGYTALYKYFVSSGEIKISGSEVREIIDKRWKTAEKENNKFAVSPIRNKKQQQVVENVDDEEPKIITICPPKKGILKATSKRTQHKEEEIIIMDERPDPYIPILNLESEELNDESESSSSLSVSRGQPRHTAQKPTPVVQAQPKTQQRSQKNNNTASTTISGVTEPRPRRNNNCNK